MINLARQKLRLVALSAGLSLALAACATSTPTPPPSTPAPTPAASPAPAANPRAVPTEEMINQYRTWIGWARVKHPYPESEARMYAVMMCESSGRAAIVNPAGPYTGLFQYGKPTWNDAWNTYRNDGILDPKAQIFATALAWQLKMQRHWGCYKKTASSQ